MLLATCFTARASELRAKIDQYMRASVKVDHFMGAILVAQHGRLIVAKGYGKANLKLGIPNTPDTEFRIGSVTKEFTATAILLLQARGKLNFEDPVCKYVPDCPADWQPIRIYNLLTHTSGIPNFTSFPNYRAVEKESITPARLIALFKDKPLDFKPGAKFSYSNSGYEVLGYIIERVSGESYSQFLERNIFQPLGLRATGYDSSHPAPRTHAQGYFYTPKGYEPANFVNMTVPYSAGALYSTVLDLYKWDQALDAGRVLPANLRNDMLSPHVAAGPNSHYGFGWIISSLSGHKEIWHNGGIEGFTTHNSWFPNDDAYVIVVDNMTSPDMDDIGSSLAAILFGKRYDMPKAYTPIKLPPATLQKYVGQYELGPHFILTLRRTGDQLTAQGIGQQALPIFPASKDLFFWTVVHASVSFIRDEHGQVTGLVLHQGGRAIHASRISTNVPALPKAISLPVMVLEKYVGKYQLAPDFILTVTRAGEHLVTQATGQGPVPIYAESQTEFFARMIDARITFVADSKGEITGLVLHQGGRDLPAKRLN
ncbi:MAG: serine hydrolase [Steroidobacteraceae bacterium]